MDVVLLLQVKKNPSSSSPIALRALLRSERTPTLPPLPLHASAALPPPQFSPSTPFFHSFSSSSSLVPPPPALYYSTRRRYKPLFSLCGERRGGGERESAPSDEKTELRSRGEKGDKRERKKGHTHKSAWAAADRAFPVIHSGTSGPLLRVA